MIIVKFVIEVLITESCLINNIDVGVDLCKFNKKDIENFIFKFF